MRPEYDRYRGPADNPDEAQVPGTADGINVYAFLKKDLLWGHAGDAGSVAEVALDATQALVKAVGHDAPILKEEYLDLVCAVTDKVQTAQRESDATNRKSYEKDGNIEELELKVRILSDDSVAVVYLKKTLAARNMWIAVTEETSVNLNKALVSMIQRHCASRMELDSARSAIDGEESVIRDFADKVCKGYSSLLRARPTRYRNRLNSSLADALLKWSILAGFA